MERRDKHGRTEPRAFVQITLIPVPTDQARARRRKARRIGVFHRERNAKARTTHFSLSQFARPFLLLLLPLPGCTVGVPLFLSYAILSFICSSFGFDSSNIKTRRSIEARR